MFQFPINFKSNNNGAMELTRLPYEVGRSCQRNRAFAKRSEAKDRRCHYCCWIFYLGIINYTLHIQNIFKDIYNSINLLGPWSSPVMTPPLQTFQKGVGPQFEKLRHTSLTLVRKSGRAHYFLFAPVI